MIRLAETTKYGTIKPTIDLSILDVFRDILWTPAINLTADRVGSSQDFQNGTPQLLGERLEAHGACDIDNLVERNGLGVLDVLLLLSVTRGFLEGLDD